MSTLKTTKDLEKSEKKQEKRKQNKTERWIINILTALPYLDYCLQNKKNILFLYNHQVITPRQASKIAKRDKFCSKSDVKKQDEFLTYIAKIALEDKEYTTWYEETYDMCEECGYTPMKDEKCSKYHPQWQESCKHDLKIFRKIYKKKKHEPPLTFRKKCPICNYEYYYSTGVDKEPEKGLR